MEQNGELEIVIDIKETYSLENEHFGDLKEAEIRAEYFFYDLQEKIESFVKKNESFSVKKLSPNLNFECQNERERRETVSKMQK